MSCVQSVLDPADWSNDLLITIHVDEGFHHVLELGIVLSVERQLAQKVMAANKSFAKVSSLASRCSEGNWS